MEPIIKKRIEVDLRRSSTSLPHVAERHRRAGFMPIHPTKRRVAPKMEIISAMIITIPKMKMSLRLRRCRSIRCSVASGITHSNRGLIPGPGGGATSRRTRRLLAASVAPRAARYNLDQEASSCPREFFGALCQTTCDHAPGTAAWGR